jgi:hypothetical protein
VTEVRLRVTETRPDGSGQPVVLREADFETAYLDVEDWLALVEVASEDDVPPVGTVLSVERTA